MDLKQFHFSGTLRPYQKKVADNADKYLKDGKIHIAAAPGSGKTTLGLELVCRLGAPALILSPSVTIRSQWGERFLASFVPEGFDAGSLISCDLHFPAEITSVTYQALHAAITRTTLTEENDDGCETKSDFTGFSLFDTLRSAGIKTLVLDEAHHLKAEWQSALEQTVGTLGSSVKIICLTATPPYEATKSEWEKYEKLCGPIDEEISVPELVARKNLCPHRDYVHFSFPTPEEESRIVSAAKRAKADAADEINKTLSNSLAKLPAAAEILSNEYASLGGRLRMLVLTDYIRQEAFSAVGTESSITALGALPFFEYLRRTAPAGAKLAVLTGPVVIIPDESKAEITDIALSAGSEFKTRIIPETEYSEMIFSGSNKVKVSVITKAFGEGLINVLIGTKALLGEGWDAPCINSLILASSTGSFMLSNQMRGRAIRTDSADPGKSANIWHLATLPPLSLGEGYIKDTLRFGADYSLIERRFKSSLAPAYDYDSIENGMRRAGIAFEDFKAGNAAGLNEKAFALASDREGMKAGWSRVFGGNESPEVSDVAAIPATLVPSVSPGGKYALAAVFAVLAVIMLILPLSFALLKIAKFLLAFIFAVCAAAFFASGKEVSTPEKRMTIILSALIKALETNGMLRVRGTKPSVKEENGVLYASVSGVPEYDKRMFAQSVGEMFGKNDSPRYIFIPSEKINSNVKQKYEKILICPSFAAKKKETAAEFANNIKKATGTLTPLYVSGEKGAETLASVIRNAPQYSLVPGTEVIKKVIT